MSIALNINGVVYNYPETGDNDWGPDATAWASAVTSGMLQKAGGLFQLLAEVDFGTSYGVKSLYYKSRTSNPASAGQVRLARADVINWRNQANSADLSLGVSASDILQFNGVNVQNSLSVTDTSTIDLTFAADTLSADIVAGSITNSMINAAAAIAYSKLDLADSIVNADINTSAAIAYSKLNLGGSIVNSDISNSAAIANAKLANMNASTFKGRNSGGGAGAPQDLTVTQATALLDAFVGDSGSGGTKGLVPAPASGDAAANKFLNADGTWKAAAAGGDVVGPGSSTDNGFARFDGLTGKLLKNSPATITNADVVAAAAIALNKLAATTASRALVSDGSGFITAATTTATEIGYVNGVTSAIQTQINSKLPTTITTTGDMIYSSSGTTASALAIGSNSQFMRVVSGLPAWGYQAYRAVTSTGSINMTDNVIGASSAAMTLTLPTAVGCTGKQFTIKKTDPGLSNIITIDGNSTETIDGFQTVSLGRENEAITIVSNGSNWIVTDYYYKVCLVGTAQIATTNNLAGWTRTNTALGVVASDADCPDTTVLTNPGPGAIQTTNNDLPRFIVNDLPAGTFKVTVVAPLSDVSGSVDYSLAVTDGTTISPVFTQLGGGTTSSTATGIFSYSSIGNRTYDIYIAAASGSVSIVANQNNRNVSFMIERVG